MISEPEILTSVRVPIPVHAWIKQNRTPMRAVLMAGVERLKDQAELEKLRVQVSEMRQALVRSARHKDMVFYIFKHYPKIYDEARQHCADGD